MPEAKRTRLEADRPLGRFVSSCLLHIASVPIRRNAPVPNESTAKLINAYGNWTYEQACPTGKPNRSHRKPTRSQRPQRAGRNRKTLAV